MAVDAVASQLVGHDPSPRIVDQNINSISALSDLVCHLRDLMPIWQIAMQPGHPVCYFLSHLLFDSVSRAINHLLSRWKNEELLHALGQHCMRTAIANALRATGDNSYFALEVGCLVEGKLLVLGKDLMACITTEVLGNSLFDSLHAEW